MSSPRLTAQTVRHRIDGLEINRYRQEQAGIVRHRIDGLENQYVAYVDL